jgi:hypothetical protein
MAGMRLNSWLLAGLSAIALIAACAGNPRPGEPGYRFNVEGTYRASFVVEGTPYGGTMTLATAPGGAVTGSMIVVDPSMDSSVTGSVAADTLRLTIPYSMPNGCTGTASLLGPIADGGGGASGRMDLQDSCGGGLAGTFSFSR